MMYIKQRYRAIVLFGLAWLILATLPSSRAISFAEQNDARLKKRISELETENRSLRKVIAEIQSALKSVPESTILTAPNSSDLRIVVMPGEWGGSGLVDMRKVCESAAGAITAQLPDDGFPPIILQRNNSVPITLFRRGKGNEHIVQVNTGGRAWAQLAYQFSHEFCHIVCNYRDAENPQLWFEETICECASLYSLRQMSVEWKTNAPYSNWNGYSSSLASYASGRMKPYEGRKESTAEFYRANLAELQKNGTNRELNTFIAVKLLPHFEAKPSGWEALRYINLGPVAENNSFKAYLNGWHDRVPEKHRPFVQQIAAEFEVELKKELR